MKTSSILKLSQQEIDQFFVQLENYDYTRHSRSFSSPTFVDDFAITDKSGYNLFITHHYNTSVLSDKDTRNAHLE